MRTICSLKNGQFAFSSLHERCSRACEGAGWGSWCNTKGNKNTHFELRPIKYSDQASNCMFCHNNEN